VLNLASRSRTRQRKEPVSWPRSMARLRATPAGKGRGRPSRHAQLPTRPPAVTGRQRRSRRAPLASARAPGAGSAGPRIGQVRLMARGPPGGSRSCLPSAAQHAPSEPATSRQAQSARARPAAWPLSGRTPVEACGSL
jgi:hypothetical protein